MGRYREVRDPAHGLMPIPVAAAATVGYSLAFAAVSFMLEIGATVSALVFRDDGGHRGAQRADRPALLRARAGASCGRSLAVDPVDAQAQAPAARESGPLGLRGLEV